MFILSIGVSNEAFRVILIFGLNADKNGVLKI